MADTFWVDTFWESTFWVDGFWTNDGAPPEEDPGAGGKPNRLKLKKRDNLEEIRRASQAAILRRRHAEELKASVQKVLDKAIPAGATVEYDPQVNRIALVTDKLEQEIAIHFHAKLRAEAEIEAEEQTRKRRKRDQLAVILLLH